MKLNLESASGNCETGCDDHLTRRSFIARAGISGIGLSAGAVALSGCGDEPAKTSSVPPKKDGETVEPIQQIDIDITINKQKQKLKVDTRTTLLDLLRENMALTGTKKGCDHGQCGACTILVNGKTLNSCLALAVMYSGSEITTIEGLGTDTELHPVQAAFIKHDAFQCGYCTPGQIMSAVSLVNQYKKNTTDEIREYMSGNICRCGAYCNIVAAIQEVQTTTGSAQEKKA